MPPHHSCPTNHAVHFPKQLEHRECSEEGSETHKGFFVWHSCASSIRNISTWAVIYVSWQGFATKRMISIKRPKTHVSLKKNEEK